MEKAIEIKRRAQRCVQNGDLDGALSEYEKLVATEDSDPYNFVLLADLLYKKGETGQAASRYLAAATAYEQHSLYKNAIAVCKKMMRLSLAQLEVLERLANLHILDGLATESALYSLQFADLLLAQNEVERAIAALEKAYRAAPDNLKALEKLGEARVMLGDRDAAVQTLLEASRLYDRGGQIHDADRCRRRADQLMPGASSAPPQESTASAASAPAALPASAVTPASAAPPTFAAPRTSAAPPAGPMSLESYRLSVSEVSAVSEPVMDAPEMELDEAPAASATIEEPSAADVPASNDSGMVVGPAFDTADDDGFVGPGLDEAMPALAGGQDEHGDPAEMAEAEPAVEVVPVGGDAPEIEVVAEAPSTNGDSPEAPGLRFESSHGESSEHGDAPSLSQVEHMLAQAQEFFRGGEREAASRSLTGAARAYEQIGRLDSAATIYRSLGRSAHSTRDVLLLWFGNCERRREHGEAAQVACELGDRALNDGDSNEALSWFERAQHLDATNELARRRLEKLDPSPNQGGIATLAPAVTEVQPETPSREPDTRAARQAATTTGALPEPGRVEVAVGRGEAVTFDLGALIGEFQRGVEAQLAGDAQSHYDLGMTYREMGLLEQAVDSFRIAGQDPAFRGRVIEMIGRCLLDQGRFDDATQAFDEALTDPALKPLEHVSVRYLLGLAYEAAGRLTDALAEFERAYAAQPNFPDVANKIRVLRKTLETF